MSRVKHEHFVPQFYLKRFTENGKRLYVFDKHHQKTFAANVSTTGSQAGFYDWGQEQVDDFLTDLQAQKANATGANLADLEEIIALLRETQTQLVENHLAELESHFAKIYREFVEQLERQNIPKFTPELRENLSFFLALQIQRTSEYREYLSEVLNKGGTALIRMSLRTAKSRNHPDISDIDSEMIDKISMRYDETAIRLYHTMGLLDFDKIVNFAKVLRHHIWYIGINKTSYPLWTSDNPVVRHAHKKELFRNNRGLASPGIQIAFPLTPNFVLVLIERSYFSQFAWLDGTVYPLEKDQITFYNSMQVNDSSRQIYSFKSDFGLAEKMCHDHPELTNPNRPRIQVDSG